MQLNAFLHYEESLCVSVGRRKEIISPSVARKEHIQNLKTGKYAFKAQFHARLFHFPFIYLSIYIFMRLSVFVTGSDLGVPWFASPRSLIGLENSCHPLNQSDAKHRSIVKWPLAFSRVWGWLMLVLFTHEFSQASCHIYFWSDRPDCRMYWMQLKSKLFNWFTVLTTISISFIQKLFSLRIVPKVTNRMHCIKTDGAILGTFSKPRRRRQRGRGKWAIVLSREFQDYTKNCLN